MGMEQPTPPRSPGRPKVKESYDKPRTAGRHGVIWDECVEQAKADGQSMTEFVAEAIERELARRRRKAARR
jgi:hypothetical protein